MKPQMVLETKQKKEYTAIVSVTKTSLINLVKMSNKVLNLLFIYLNHISYTNIKENTQVCMYVPAEGRELLI